MAGADRLLKDWPKALGPDVRVVRAPCMGACDHGAVCAVGMCRLNGERVVGEKHRLSGDPCVYALQPGTDFSITWRPAAIAFSPKPSPESAPATS